MTSGSIWATILALACLAAAGMDIGLRRIPNWLCAATLIAGVGFASHTGGLSALALHSAHAAIALVIGMVLFATGAIGGGDAKFYAAAAMWFTLADAPRLLMAISLTGFVSVLVWIAARRLQGRPWRKGNGDPFASFPYGLAIGLGALAAFV